MEATAAIYARLSVDRDGKKVGIDTQLEDSRKLALERGWTVVREYVDRNLSAADKLVKRPEYDRMVQDFGLGQFANIVCWDLDRLTRQPRQLEDWIDAAETRQVTVVTANGEADLGNDGGRLYARVKVAVAKGEAERASSRQKRSKQSRREKGQWHGGTVPYGFQTVPGESRLIPNPDEVLRVHEVARRVLEDRESMHSIVTDWNNNGFTTRAGKHWRQANLRSIMLNRSMLGETKAGVVGWDSIIEKRTFDRMTALLTDPSRKVVHSPGLKSKKYAMGGGLSVCGVCGKALITHGKVSGGSRTTTLACLARVHGPSDKHPRVERERLRNGELTTVLEDTGRVSISHDPLEEVVFEALIAKLKASPRFLQRMGEQDPETDQRLDHLEQQRRDLRFEKERAQNAYVKGIMDERKALAEVQRIDALIENISKEYDSLLRLPISVGDFDAESGIDWRAWTAGRRRAALLGFISRVEVQPYPAGAKRTRPKFKNESLEDYESARWSILKEAAGSRIEIRWKWESV
ncbi:recombinase family protein [Salinibacterium sp. SWN139]|uniref:recombinase family protein n=1 Tax=Salinibacterium sp. SWN139 TaxID=2792055 RepID=UPI0018CF02E6|nr:recombinase family protein [Salinibacterium sp. SWN139]MBH0053779.1 recombinase family protein [Salinibacterium sp. SWN139]